MVQRCQQLPQQSRPPVCSLRRFGALALAAAALARSASAAVVEPWGLPERCAAEDLTTWICERRNLTEAHHFEGEPQVDPRLLVKGDPNNPAVEVSWRIGATHQAFCLVLQDGTKAPRDGYEVIRRVAHAVGSSSAPPAAPGATPAEAPVTAPPSPPPPPLPPLMPPLLPLAGGSILDSLRQVHHNVNKEVGNALSSNAPGQLARGVTSWLNLKPRPAPEPAPAPQPPPLPTAATLQATTTLPSSTAIVQPTREAELAAGDICYRFCEDGSEETLQLRDLCPDDALCNSSGLETFDACGARAHRCGGQIKSGVAVATKQVPCAANSQASCQGVCHWREAEKRCTLSLTAHAGASGASSQLLYALMRHAIACGRKLRRDCTDDCEWNQDEPGELGNCGLGRAAISAVLDAFRFRPLAAILVKGLVCVVRPQQLCAGTCEWNKTSRRCGVGRIAAGAEPAGQGRNGTSSAGFADATPEVLVRTMQCFNETGKSCVGDCEWSVDHCQLSRSAMESSMAGKLMILTFACARSSESACLAEEECEWARTRKECHVDESHALCAMGGEELRQMGNHCSKWQHPKNCTGNMGCAWHEYYGRCSVSEDFAIAKGIHYLIGNSSVQACGLNDTMHLLATSMAKGDVAEHQDATAGGLPAQSPRRFTGGAGLRRLDGLQGAPPAAAEGRAAGELKLRLAGLAPLHAYVAYCAAVELPYKYCRRGPASKECVGEPHEGRLAEFAPGDTVARVVFKTSVQMTEGRPRQSSDSIGTFWVMLALCAAVLLIVLGGLSLANRQRLGQKSWARDVMLPRPAESELAQRRSGPDGWSQLRDGPT